MSQHESTYVPEIPPCDIGGCDGRAWADAKLGQATAWAYVCKRHFVIFGCRLGSGRGQQLLRPDLEESS